MSDEPLITVLTPTWNRGEYLDRVWSGLVAQEYRHFEWVVADDGSTDDTAERVRAFAVKSPFPIIYIRADTRVGKSRIDNEGIKAASGELLIWNDSDDYLLPEALARMVQCWLSIPSLDRSEYIGVTGFCRDNRGDVLAVPDVDGNFDSTWRSIFNERIADVTMLLRTDKLKLHPFPEVDFYIPEGSMYSYFWDMKTRVVPEILLVKEYQSTNPVSFSGKMQYCRGRAISFAISDRNAPSTNASIRTRFWRLITFIRCAIHGELSVIDQLHWLGRSHPQAIYWAAYPAAAALAVRDKVRGVVRYTHRDFLIARDTATIAVTEFKEPPV